MLCIKNLFLGISAFTSLASAYPTEVIRHPLEYSNVTYSKNPIRTLVHMPGFPDISTLPDYGPVQVVRRECSADRSLTVMAAGGSLAVGYPAEGDDHEFWGYRQALQKDLSADGVNITYVGSEHRGTGYNVQKWEGRPGIQIADLHKGSIDIIKNINPDVILFTVGTADVLYPSDSAPVSGAADRMGSFLEEIWSWKSNAVVVLSAIPLINDVTMNQNAKTINTQFRARAQQYLDSGKHILYADVSGDYSTTELIDVSNPNKTGYTKLAARYAQAISHAVCLGWFA